METIADHAFSGCDIPEFHIPASVKTLGLCCGYYTGDLYVHGMKTKIKESPFVGMPLTVHAPAGSLVAKSSEKNIFKNFVVPEEP